MGAIDDERKGIAVTGKHVPAVDQAADSIVECLDFTGCKTIRRVEEHCQAGRPGGQVAG